MPRRRGPTLIQRSRAVPAEQKAAFHDTQGGSKVWRPFLGITTEDEEAILTRFEAGLERALKEQ
jgi:hypothetical protein